LIDTALRAHRDAVFANYPGLEVTREDRRQLVLRAFALKPTHAAARAELARLRNH
jgi:hypothetical protein